MFAGGHLRPGGQEEGGGDVPAEAARGAGDRVQLVHGEREIRLYINKQMILLLHLK